MVPNEEGAAASSFRLEGPSDLAGAAQDFVFHPARVPARPLDDTSRDVLAAGPAPADKSGSHVERAGLSPEREAQLLAKLDTSP